MVLMCRLVVDHLIKHVDVLYLKHDKVHEYLVVHKKEGDVVVERLRLKLFYVKLRRSD
jgi:hypothetical protein